MPRGERSGMLPAKHGACHTSWVGATILPLPLHAQYPSIAAHPRHLCPADRRAQSEESRTLLRCSGATTGVARQPTRAVVGAVSAPPPSDRRTDRRVFAAIAISLLPRRLHAYPAQ